jgi:hypothetical protein
MKKYHNRFIINTDDVVVIDNIVIENIVIENVVIDLLSKEIK